MTRSSLQRLRAELGDADVRGLDVLTDDELNGLVAAIAAAKARQSELLAEAAEQGLRHLPLVARAAVRRALFP